MATMGPRAVEASAKARGLDGNVTLDFYGQWANDADRTDIGTSKCLHCLFRRNCCHVPQGCGFIDDRTPVWRVSFTVWINTGWRDYACARYDCGLFKDDEGLVSVVMPDEFDMKIETNMSVYHGTPFSSGLSPMMAVPRRGETFETFNERVERETNEIKALLSNDLLSGTPKAKVRMIIEKTGHLDDLNELYGGDVEFMASDYWPGMTFDEIVDMYGRKKVIVTPDVYRENVGKLYKRKKEVAADARL